MIYRHNISRMHNRILTGLPASANRLQPARGAEACTIAAPRPSRTYYELRCDWDEEHPPLQLCIISVIHFSSTPLALIIISNKMQGIKENSEKYSKYFPNISPRFASCSIFIIIIIKIGNRAVKSRRGCSFRNSTHNIKVRYTQHSISALPANSSLHFSLSLSLSGGASRAQLPFSPLYSAKSKYNIFSFCCCCCCFLLIISFFF